MIGEAGSPHFSDPPPQPQSEPSQSDMRESFFQPPAQKIQLGDTERQSCSSKTKPSSRWGIRIMAPGEEFPAEVVPGSIFVGNHEQANNREMLVTLGVTHVVNASRKDTNPFPDFITYCNCGVTDNSETDISTLLEISFRFINSAMEHNSKTVVLVHCSRGVSRSVAIVAGYLMRKFALPFHESIQRIRKNHPAAEPNCG
mmetsp:Transcript_31318/g.64909  ORF Transcript_31318/g.64909 Transcript_31318/m.64909 type:complete len:200 (+) Transcript_31318:24-623(+)